jgi:hypothetical protein
MHAMLQQSDFAFADRVRLPLAVDAAALRDDLDRIGREGWIDHPVKQNYEGGWSVLPLRIPAGATHPVMMIHADPAATLFEDRPVLARTPGFRALLDRLACPLQSVRLMRLAPGARIKAHRDHDLAAEWGAARIHVPVATNDAVEFRLNDERVAMPVGSAWYLRLSDPHSVINRGATDRVHLVIDCVANEWLRAMLEDGGGPRGHTKQPISTMSVPIG